MCGPRTVGSLHVIHAEVVVTRVENVPVAHHHPPLHLSSERQADEAIDIGQGVRKDGDFQIPDVVFPQQDLEAKFVDVLEGFRARLLEQPSFLEETGLWINFGVGDAVPAPLLDPPGETFLRFAELKGADGVAAQTAESVGCAQAREAAYGVRDPGVGGYIRSVLPNRKGELFLRRVARQESVDDGRVMAETVGDDGRFTRFGNLGPLRGRFLGDSDARPLALGPEKAEHLDPPPTVGISQGVTHRHGDHQIREGDGLRPVPTREETNFIHLEVHIAPSEESEISLQGRGARNLTQDHLAVYRALNLNR